MKRKILSIVGVAAFAVAVAFNINASINGDAELDVTLANVEALARGESGGMGSWATAVDSNMRPKCCAEVTSGSCSLSNPC